MTTREIYVMAKALAYAIKTIESMPQRWQEWSDKEDMKIILHQYFPVFENMVQQSAEHHIDGSARDV